MNPYIRLARLTVENFVKKGETISPPSDLPKNFYNQKAGVFVSLEIRANSKKGA